MPVAVKICGLADPVSVAAAVAGGASWLGFVFYPKSPRNVAASRVAEIASSVPAGVGRVGLFVDATDDFIAATLAVAPIDILQLHGAETPVRAAALRARFGRPVMKALPVAEAADLDAASSFAGVADMLLFDAKPPKDPAALPGGNGLPFDWRLLEGRKFELPWLLSGGLRPETLADAVRLTGATAVDVSSGVESAPGVKDPARIAAFLAAARAC